MSAAHTQTGWTDDRMMQAFDLIWEVYQANKVNGAAPDLGDLLGQIIDCDNVLAEALAGAA